MKLPKSKPGFETTAVPGRTKPEPPRSTLSAAKGTPLQATTKEERAGLEQRGSVKGSNIAAARLHEASQSDAERLLAELPSHLALPLIDALKKARGAQKREVDVGVRLLLDQPEPTKTAVAVLTGQPRRDTSDEFVQRFRQGSLSVTRIAEGLAGLGRAHEVKHVTAYLPGELGRTVQAEMLAYPDAKQVKQAIDWITRMTPRQGRGKYLLERLRRSGLLEDSADGPKLIRGVDSVASLAAARRENLRPTAGYVASPQMKAEAERLAGPIRASGLLDDPHWQRSDASGRRGLLGEHLRKTEVEAEIAGTRAKVVQGILIFHAPPELKALRTAEEARAYCEERDLPTSRIYHAITAAGDFYGLSITELDLAVLEEEPDGRIRFLRFENVKAGPGNAGHAREQNEKARIALGDPDTAFVFPDGQTLRDRSADLVRDNPDSVVLETVGPIGSESYTKSYGLSSDMLDLVRDALSA